MSTAARFVDYGSLHTPDVALPAQITSLRQRIAEPAGRTGDHHDLPATAVRRRRHQNDTFTALRSSTDSTSKYSTCLKLENSTLFGNCSMALFRRIAASL